MARKSICTLILVSTLGLISGCTSKRPADMPPLYDAKVTVIQDEKPLENASVALMPLEPEKKWSAGGRTDENGVAVLSVHGRYPGAAAGKYKVIVTKTEAEPIPPNKLTPSGRPVPGYEEKIFNLVAPKFRDEKNVEEIEVVSKGRNRWTIDVGKSVKVKLPSRSEMR